VPRQEPNTRPLCTRRLLYFVVTTDHLSTPHFAYDLYICRSLIAKRTNFSKTLGIYFIWCIRLKFFGIWRRVDWFLRSSVTPSAGFWTTGTLSTETESFSEMYVACYQLHGIIYMYLNNCSSSARLSAHQISHQRY